jgi:hypothetical protein
LASKKFPANSQRRWSISPETLLSALFAIECRDFPEFPARSLVLVEICAFWAKFNDFQGRDEIPLFISLHAGNFRLLTNEEIATSRRVLEEYGGDDETRTRDLCRDRAAF